MPCSGDNSSNTNLPVTFLPLSTGAEPIAEREVILRGYASQITSIPPAVTTLEYSDCCENRTTGNAVGEKREGHGDGVGNGKGEGKENPLKRPAPSSTSPGHEGVGNQEEDNPSHPKKRPPNFKQKSTKTSSSSGTRPFACPYFKKNPLKYHLCNEWHGAKLRNVKTHISLDHLKPVQCGRCGFRSGDGKEITQHLRSGDCERLEILQSIEEDIKKAGDVDKAMTWEKIYQTLFPPDIPDPFWSPGGALTSTVDSLQSYTEAPEYQVGLASFIRNRESDLPETDIEGLLTEYNTYWTPNSHDQLREDSGIGTRNGEGFSQDNSFMDEFLVSGDWVNRE